MLFAGLARFATDGALSTADLAGHRLLGEPLCVAPASNISRAWDVSGRYGFLGSAAVVGGFAATASVSKSLLNSR